jgi:hypothetical protein
MPDALQALLIALGEAQGTAQSPELERLRAALTVPSRARTLNAGSLADPAVGAALRELVAGSDADAPSYLVIAASDPDAWRELARSFEGALEGALPPPRWRELALARGELIVVLCPPAPLGVLSLPMLVVSWRGLLIAAADPAALLAHLLDALDEGLGASPRALADYLELMSGNALMVVRRLDPEVVAKGTTFEDFRPAGASGPETTWRERRLEAAMPATGVRGVPLVVHCLVALPGSTGLARFLQATAAGGPVRPDDVRGYSARLPFPGGRDAATFYLQLEAHSCEPAEQRSVLHVPADFDSGVVTFRVRPLGGEGRLSLVVRLFADEALAEQLTSLALYCELQPAGAKALAGKVWSLFREALRPAPLGIVAQPARAPLTLVLGDQHNLFVSGDQYDLSGDFRGALLNLKSDLQHVSQQVTHQDAPDARRRERVAALLDRLATELAAAPPELLAPALALGAEVQRALAGSVRTGQTLDAPGQGLTDAARPFVGVMPAVPLLAAEIAAALAPAPEG